MDSNHRTHMRTDLQSAAFSHSAICPNIICTFSMLPYYTIRFSLCQYFFHIFSQKLINILQLSWWFFKYAHRASLPATSKDVPFLTDSCFFYLLPLKWVYIFYCQLITQSVFFQLICYVFFYLFCIFSYCINIISSTPKFSISIFIFHISPLAIYHYATFSF